MNAYELYSKDFIPCMYCNKLVSLYNATAHLRTKSCIGIQQLMDEPERNKLLISQKREINKIKSTIRLSKDDEEVKG
jgi:phage FluMu protein Com